MRFLPLLLTGLCSLAGASPLIHIDTNASRVKVEVDMKMQGVAATDVLFVIDDSGSMSTHQRNLAQNIPVLVNSLISSGLDFHAAVITTDGDNYRGKLPGQFRGGVVTSDMPNAADLLSANLLPGTSGSPQEMVFDPVMAALSEPMLSGPNAGFLRPDAGLSVITVTDAEDQSAVNNKDSFVSFIRGLKGDSGLVSMHGILALQSDPNCQRDGADFPLKLETAISELGGKAFSLCAPNYTENIKAIASALAAANKSTDPVVPVEPLTSVHLPLTPKFDTIRVAYGWQVLPKNDSRHGWSFDWTTNEILLGSEIVWTRQPIGTPLTITFVPTVL